MYFAQEKKIPQEQHTKVRRKKFKEEFENTNALQVRRFSIRE